MTKALLGLLVALTVSQTANVEALESYTITGPTDLYYTQYFTPGLLGGEYVLKYNGDAAPVSLFIENVTQYTFNDYNNDGVEIDGDDVSVFNDFFLLYPPANFTTTAFFPDVPADLTVVDSTDPDCVICYTVYSYRPLYTSYALPFGTDPPTGEPIAGSFTLTISSVPEPGTWLLLTMGLGGVGYALRRRSSAKISASDALASDPSAENPRRW